LFKLQGLPEDRCKTAVSAHPFTSGSNTNDIRYTVRYLEDNLASSIYAALHEGGHAMYELNINPEYNYTAIYDGASMTMHESQSRIYENNIGRSKDFSKHVYKEVKEVFPDKFGDVSEEDFYRYVNFSSPSFIRVEADELTYSLHIMVRYHIERMIFNEGADVAELPAIWNKKYEEFLGITPPNDALGILQDVHWSNGLFGYFPTYSLGTACSAQFEEAMSKKIDFAGALQSGDLSPITGWLKENVHKYGKLLTDDEIITAATGKAFDPSAYTRYLDGKYRELY
jgi:carboxypeptidase Taq